MRRYACAHEGEQLGRERAEVGAAGSGQAEHDGCLDALVGPALPGQAVGVGDPHTHDGARDLRAPREPGDRDALVVAVSGQPGHGGFDGVELADHVSQVVGAAAPRERGARVVGRRAPRVEVGGLDNDEPVYGPEAVSRSWSSVVGVMPCEKTTTGRSSPRPGASRGTGLAD